VGSHCPTSAVIFLFGMSQKIKNIFSIFSLKKKPVRHEPLPSSILSYITVCFQYINKFTSHQVQNLYSFKRYQKIKATNLASLSSNSLVTYRESIDLMNAMINSTFDESSMQRLFDPFIILEAIQLTLKKYEPIFPFSFSKQLFLLFQNNQSVNLNELIFGNFSKDQYDFLNSLMDHINHLLRNETAEKSELLAIYSDLLIELYPEDRHEMGLNETQEATRAVDILTQIYEHWVPTNETKNTQLRIDQGESSEDDGSTSGSPEYSIQERTLKVSFPKGDEEENTISRGQLSQILSTFGEISEVTLTIAFSLL
jgi:hypothetical protein